MYEAVAYFSSTLYPHQLKVSLQNFYDTDYNL